MELRKIINTENRPLDYLKERNCKSSIQNRKDFGTSLIGWQATRLRENMAIKGSHGKAVKFFDNMKNNRAVEHQGIFTRIIDKKLGMERGYPYHKLDMRKQRILVKKVDKFNKQIEVMNATSKTQNYQTTRSNASPNKNRYKKSATKFSSISNEKGAKSKNQLKRSIKEMYDKIYESKLKAHFSVPYPKFPYNLDKDTIHISKEKSKTRDKSRKTRTAFSVDKKPGKLF